MSDERWIVVPNWDTFQHYGNREPTWLKLYLELRDKPEWEALNYTERGLLVSIWMEYCAARGQLSCSRLGKKTRLTTRSEHLASLNHAGFIQLAASKPLALARSREVREEEEKKKTRARAREPGPAHAPAATENGAASLPIDPNAGATAINVARVTRLIQLGILQDEVDLEAELRGFKITGAEADQLRELLP